MTAVVVHRHFRSLRPASPLLHLPCRLRPTIGAPLQTPITRYGSFTFYCTISRFSLTSSIVSAPLASSPTKDSPFISTTCRTNVWVFEVEFSQMEHLCRCKSSLRVFKFSSLSTQRYRYDCNGTQAQRWIINRGSTKVQIAGTNFCLDAGTSQWFNLSAIIELIICFYRPRKWCTAQDLAVL